MCKIIRTFFYCNILLVGSNVYAEGSSILEDIKQLLEQNNTILTDQSLTIQQLQEQNVLLKSEVDEVKHQFRLQVQKTSTRSQRVTDTVKKTNPSVTPKPINQQTHYSVTPRIALRFNAFHDYSTNINTQSTLQEPVYQSLGLTFGIHHLNTSLLITGLYGQSENQLNFVLIPDDPDKPPVIPGIIDRNSSISNFEIIVRRQINDSPTNWFAGLEYINLDIDRKIASAPSIFRFSNGSDREKTFFKYYLLKLGYGYFLSFPNNRHRIFSNALLGFGLWDSKKSDKAVLTALDLNMGYEWIVSQQYSLAARYRGQFAFTNGLNSDVTGFGDQSFVFHGPELMLTYRF